jgi:hypothetical protein
MIVLILPMGVLALLISFNRLVEFSKAAELEVIPVLCSELRLKFPILSEVL